MLIEKKYKTIYFVLGLIISFFLFMFISAGVVINDIGNSSSSKMIKKSRP